MKFFTLFALVLLSHSVLTAQVFVKHDASGNNDGSSWEHAFANLQDAIDAASPGGQVWIAAGTYIPEGPTPDSSHFWVLKPLSLYGGFAGTESQLEERDPTVNQTILSGDKNGDDVPGQFTSNRTDNAHHVLIVDAPDGTCVIDGLRFQGGMTRTDAFNPTDDDLIYHRWRGGALYIRTSATLDNCIFRDNNGHQGTGLYALGASLDYSLHVTNTVFDLNNSNAGACYISGWNDVTVDQCTFTKNVASGFGAGLVIGNSNSTVSECLFETNRSSAEGGAIMLFQNQFITISDPVIHVNKCTFDGNSAVSRGGAMNFNNFNNGFTLTIDSCNFIGNVVTSPSGSAGALRISDQTDQGTIAFETYSVNILNSHFSESTAGFGGAVMVVAIDDSISVQVSNTTLSNNLAIGSAGGLLLARATNGRIGYAIRNTAFMNNSAESYAGALEITYADGLIENSTFSGNEGIEASGGFDIAGGNTVISGCQFSGNHTTGTYQGYEGGGAGIFWGGGVATVHNSIFDGNSSDAGGAAMLINNGASVHCENVLFQNSIGFSTIESSATLSLLNSTFAGNEFGLFLRDASTTEFQNSIFMNTAGNLATETAISVISKGGNISHDALMAAVLTVTGEYADLNETEPLLGPDNVPLAGSPCIDAGNPDGVTSLFDLAGHARVQGKSIDIGSYESFSTAVKDVSWNAPDLRVFPNPVHDILRIEMDNEVTGDISVAIYNAFGQRVHHTVGEKQDVKHLFQINVVHLPRGEYILLIESEGHTSGVKVIMK